MPGDFLRPYPNGRRDKSYDDRVANGHRDVADWAKGQVDWLRELTDLATTFPDTSESFLTGIELVAGNGRQPSTIRLRGQARRQQTITTSHLRWAKDRDHYTEVTSKGMDPMAKGGEFSWRFETEVAVNPLSQEAFAKRFPQQRQKEFAPPAPRELVADIGIARRIKPPAISRTVTDPKPTATVSTAAPPPTR